MNNIIELFQKNVLKTPAKIAVIFRDTQYTYFQLERDVKRVSFYFEQKGIQQGSHVVFLLNSSYEFIVSMLAIANLGATLVPLSTTMKIKAILIALASTNSTHIISHPVIVNKLNNTNMLPLEPENVFSVDFNIKIHNEDYILNANNIPIYQDYILTMTSGSTGNPKPIVFTQKTKINRAIMAAKELYRLNSNEVIIAASPLYHSMGQRLVLLPLLIGGTSIVLDKFTPKLWIEAVKKHNVTFTIAIASHLEMLVKVIDDEDKIDSLKAIVSSSSLLSAPVKRECLKKFNCDFHECYGASEVGIVTNLSPKDCKESISSVGKALDFVEIKIVDSDKAEVKNGTIGEIICKSKTTFSRYYNNEEKTKESVVDGYFYTGDLGYVDNDGYLYLSGRKKDVIIVGGTNVYPVDVENIITKVDGIKECSVIGIKDEYFGEAILAVMVVDGGLFNLKDVKLACARELADYQQPMAYELVSALPKNSLGKVMKHELRDIFKDYDATKALRKIMDK